MPLILPTGEANDGTPLNVIVRQQAQFQARTAILGATAITALTDSAGGTADTAANGRRIFRPATAVGGPNVSTNLAQKASAETQIALVVDALREIVTKSNAMATRLGLPNITYNGGGAAADDTIAAISNSVTAATTGCEVVVYNAVMNALAEAFGAIGGHVSRIALACGVTPPRASGWTPSFPNEAFAVLGATFGSWSVTGLRRVSNVVTVETAKQHSFVVGQGVVIASANDAGFNGNFVVASLLGPRMFTYAQTAADTTSFGGTATPAIAALSTNTGTAASPGVLKTEADAALSILRNNVATLAAVLNACRVQGTPTWVAG